MKIRIMNDPKRAIISASENAELSDEVKLRIAVWLVSGILRKLDVSEVELAYQSSESHEQP